jgi:hypothetical protein
MENQAPINSAGSPALTLPCFPFPKLRKKLTFECDGIRPKSGSAERPKSRVTIQMQGGI